MGNIKLITEATFNDVDVSSKLDESTGKKQWYIGGVFMQHSTPNRNRRVYEEHILDREYDKYMAVVRAGRAIGETNHPEYIEPDPNKASHRIVEMYKDGTNYIGKSLVLNTPHGIILQGLLEGGYNPGVSTRGAGSLREGKANYSGFSMVNDDYMLSCVDVVHSPSGIDCWVNGIYEGAEWAWQNDRLVQVAAERAKSRIDKGKMDEAKALNLFNEFMKSLTN